MSEPAREHDLWTREPDGTLRGFGYLRAETSVLANGLVGLVIAYVRDAEQARLVSDGKAGPETVQLIVSPQAAKNLAAALDKAAADQMAKRH